MSFLEITVVVFGVVLIVAIIVGARYVSRHHLRRRTAGTKSTGSK